MSSHVQVSACAIEFFQDSEWHHQVCHGNLDYKTSNSESMHTLVYATTNLLFGISTSTFKTSGMVTNENSRSHSRKAFYNLCIFARHFQEKNNLSNSFRDDHLTKPPRGVLWIAEYHLHLIENVFTPTHFQMDDKLTWLPMNPTENSPSFCSCRIDTDF